MSKNESVAERIADEQLSSWPPDAPFGILRTAIRTDLLIPAIKKALANRHLSKCPDCLHDGCPGRCDCNCVPKVGREEWLCQQLGIGFPLPKTLRTIGRVLTAAAQEVTATLTAELAAHERTRERVRVLEEALRCQRGYVQSLMAERDGIGAYTMQVIGAKYIGDIDAALAELEAVPETPAEHFRRCGPSCKHVTICNACAACYGLCEAHKSDPDASFTWRTSDDGDGR